MTFLMGLCLIATIVCFVGTGMVFSVKKGSEKLHSLTCFVPGLMILFFTTYQATLSFQGVPGVGLSSLESGVVYNLYKISPNEPKNGFNIFNVEREDGITSTAISLFPVKNSRFLILPADFPRKFIKTGTDSYRIPNEDN